MGVTSIRAVTNMSGSAILFWNQERFNLWHQRFSVDPQQTRTQIERTDNGNVVEVKDVDVWIPWCTSRDEYQRQRFITIQVDLRQATFCIWQCNDRDGDYIRFSTDCRYHGVNDGVGGTPALRVPGASEVDGNRRIEIKADGTLYLHRYS